MYPPVYLTMGPRNKFDEKNRKNFGNFLMSKQPQFIRYTPNAKAPGKNPNIEQRIVRITEQQIDPFEPSKIRNQKALKPPGSPPAPIMRAPPKKLTKEEQANWKIPPCISNWKNPRGYVIPLDKRVGVAGPGLEDVTVNDRFASLAEDLYVAERKAREEIKIRNDLAKQQKARVEEEREQELRKLAQEARMARTAPKSEEESIHERARREMMRETLREHRMAKAGKSARDRDGDRDVSEAIALGKQVQPTVRGDSVYDARLFNQGPGGLSSGFAPEDANNAFDGRLFTDRSAASGYRFDEKRIATTRQEMQDAEELAAERERKRPMLGAQSSTTNPSALEFVTEGTGDDPFGLGDLLSKKPRN
jgi:SNW domain-containing protein 1